MARAAHHRHGHGLDRHQPACVGGCVDPVADAAASGAAVRPGRTGTGGHPASDAHARVDHRARPAVSGAAAFTFAFGVFFLLKKFWGIRVSPEHEAKGLDSHEHGIRGYTITFDE